MQDSNMLSIVMATYNGENYLIAQLDSILNQNLLAQEIIIVDDHSHDQTWNILKKYAEQNPTIKIYQNSQNLGIVRTFNRAIELSTKNYIALSDQDDIWLPHKLEQLMQHIGDDLLIHSDACLVDENLQLLSDSHFNYSHKIKKINLVQMLLANSVTGCCTLFHRDLIKKYFPIPEKFYIHDHYLGLAASNENKIKFLAQTLVLYRQHSHNSMGTKLNNQFQLKNLLVQVIDSYQLLKKKINFWFTIV